MKKWKVILIIAGGFSFMIAVFQAVIAFSPTWSRRFGAPEELAANVPLLHLSGLAAAAVFAIFGFYALSGAGYFGRPPLLRTGLLGIGCVYLLRGLFVTPILLVRLGRLQPLEPISQEGLLSSIVSLLVGILYLIGIKGCWQNLRSTAVR